MIEMFKKVFATSNLPLEHSLTSLFFCKRNTIHFCCINFLEKTISPSCIHVISKWIYRRIYSLRLTTFVIFPLPFGMLLKVLFKILFENELNGLNEYFWLNQSVNEWLIFSNQIQEIRKIDWMLIFLWNFHWIESLRLQCNQSKHSALKRPNKNRQT